MPPKGYRKGQAAAARADAEDGAAGDTSISAGSPAGIDNFVLPKSIVTRIAKESLPEGVKLQKEVPLALMKGSSIFVNYLAAIAHDNVALKKQRIMQPDHVLAALDELDWGEADTLALRKDLKKQLRAFRANNEAKKAGKPLPYPATASARLRAQDKTGDVAATAATAGEGEDEGAAGSGSRASTQPPVIRRPEDEGDIPSDPEDENISLLNPEWTEEYEGSPFNSEDEAPIPEDEDDDDDEEVGDDRKAAGARVQEGQAQTEAEDEDEDELDQEGQDQDSHAGDEMEED